MRDRPISPDYPFESKYVEVLGSKIHYIEQGSGPVFLFLHGNPTWSYLWRNVIPQISAHGKCIAFDLIGFGKSDKPDISYRFLEHYKYVEGFFDSMKLKNVIVVSHDWGGVLGLYYAMNHPDNIKGIAFMETFPFTFTWTEFDPGPRLGFRLSRIPVTGRLMHMVFNLFINKLLPASVYGGITKEIHQNYRKPFPTFKSRYPIYVWPNELPVEGRENVTFTAVKKLEEYLPRFTCPMLLLTASPGLIIKQDRVEWFKKTIRDLSIKSIGQGIHYLQEDNPAGIAAEVIAWAKIKKLI